MSSNKYAIGQKKNKLYEIGPGFWNVRGHFRIFARMIDIGTQMSIAQLANGNFLVIDTVELDGHLRMQIDQLTANGELIEGVIGTHPAHIQSFQAFYEAYPQAAYYGTPRHLHVLSQIPWLGSVDDCNVRRKWEPDIEMRIPAGGEFVNPHTSSNHLISVFIYHRSSRSLHVDDTINYTEKLAFLLKFFGVANGAMAFHPSIKGAGLHPTAEAPYLFRDWMRNMLNDWPFENICCAHLEAKIGGAHAQVAELLESAEPLFAKLSEQNQKKNPKGELPDDCNFNTDITGDDCG